LSEGKKKEEEEGPNHFQWESGGEDRVRTPWRKKKGKGHEPWEQTLLGERKKREVLQPLLKSRHSKKKEEGKVLVTIAYTNAEGGGVYSLPLDRGEKEREKRHLQPPHHRGGSKPKKTLSNLFNEERGG